MNSQSQAAFLKGDKKAVAVMIKNAKKYSMTGGWGFQVWAVGDVSNPLSLIQPMPVKSCFTCHFAKGSRLHVLNLHPLRGKQEDDPRMI